MRQLLKKNALLRSTEVGSVLAFCWSGREEGKAKIEHKCMKRREKRRRVDLWIPLIQAKKIHFLYNKRWRIPEEVQEFNTVIKYNSSISKRKKVSTTEIKYGPIPMCRVMLILLNERSAIINPCPGVYILCCFFLSHGLASAFSTGRFLFEEANYPWET